MLVSCNRVDESVISGLLEDLSVSRWSVEHLSVDWWLMDRWSTCWWSVASGQWVSGHLLMGQRLVGQWRTCQWVIGWLSVVSSFVIPQFITVKVLCVNKYFFLITHQLLPICMDVVWQNSA